jgi:hypothetical protein
VNNVMTETLTILMAAVQHARPKHQYVEMVIQNPVNNVMMETPQTVMAAVQHARTKDRSLSSPQ